MTKHRTPAIQNVDPTYHTPLFYSVPKTAELLGLGQTSTWALVRDRELPVVRIGRRTLVPAAALIAFAASLTSAKS